VFTQKLSPEEFVLLGYDTTSMGKLSTNLEQIKFRE